MRTMTYDAAGRTRYILEVGPGNVPIVWASLVSDEWKCPDKETTIPVSTVALRAGLVASLIFHPKVHYLEIGMTAEEWKVKLNELGHIYCFKIREGINEADLLGLEEIVGTLPSELRLFYKITNGLRFEWFNILPIEQQADIKGRWDGLKRANSVKTTKFLGRSEDLLRKLFIFAEIGGGHCACFDRQTDSIWFQDADGIHETDFTFPEFLESPLREAAEL